MAASGGTTLDAEILYMISKQLIQDLRYKPLRSDASATLRALRLTSREFASMIIIKKALFRSLDLHARADEIDRVQRTDFSDIGPFFTRVSFFSSPFSVELKEQDCEKLLLAMAVHNESNRLEELTSCSSKTWISRRCHEDYDDCLTYRDGHWDGKLQKSRFDIRILYDWYMLNARKDEDIVLSGRLQEIWSAALEKFPNVVSCSFASVVVRDGADTDSPESLYLPGCGPRCIQEQVLRRIIAPSSRMVFDSIAKSILASGIQLKRLHLERGFFSDVASAKTRVGPDQDRMDLSRLKRFTYAWMLNDDEFSRDSSGIRMETDAFYEGRDLAKYDCEAVLAKAHRSIRTLILVHGAGPWLRGMMWPTLTGLDFPSLQSITLRKVMIEPDPFARDILRCPELQSITFNDCVLDEFCPVWKVIFDAIREHPNELQVAFQFIETAVGYRITMECNTDAEIDWEPDERSEDDIEGKLYLYLTNEGDWNSTLETHFPQ